MDAHAEALGCWERAVEKLQPLVAAGRQAQVVHSSAWAWACPRFTVGECTLALWVARPAHTDGDPADGAFTFSRIPIRPVE